MDRSLDKPGRLMDAVCYAIISDIDSDPNSFRFVGEDVQVFMGYPIGHIYPPELSTEDGLAMIAFSWMAKRGIVVLSNGDGDSYDCDWVPHGLQTEYKVAFIRGMNGYDCESFAHAICIALLTGVGILEQKDEQY